MVGPVIAGTTVAAVTAAGWMAWAVRGRSSEVFAPSVWRGRGDRRTLALTFDDGPSESTPELLELLAGWGVPATFFVCGAHVRRLPEVAREMVAAGHEVGNHTQNHARLWLRDSAFLLAEIGAAQESVAEVTGARSVLFRAPYGVRWPGLGAVQKELGLMGVMWSVIGRDWALDGRAVADRLVRGATPGGILCLHDGRVMVRNPEIGATLDGVREAVPRLLDAGYSFRRVSDLIR